MNASFQLACPVLSFLLLLSVSSAESTVSFSRDIRPILSDKCFACHGPDEGTREAELRLDQHDSAHADVLVGGDADASELLRRILSKDEDEMMPPPNTHKSVTADEAALIRAWINQGGGYEVHWAYRENRRPAFPDDIESAALNPVDAFIQSRLDDVSLSFSPAADRRTLVRRLYLDLLGVPPTPDEAAMFLEHASPRAWDALVNRLLEDQGYGERMASYWLDLVRYADTIGYHSDTHMEVSAYRDYVIEAFNTNKRFDEFTVEQLAGDLLNDPTQQQLIASGYNRLLQTTEEGGAQAKEYIAIYAADRVRSVSGVWMGATLGCAQCHDHKYDPFTARDFYSMAAFFSDIKETAIGKRKPNLKLYSTADRARIERLRKEIAESELSRVLKSSPALAETVAKRQAAWEATALSNKNAKLPKEVKQALEVAADQRNDKQRAKLAGHYWGIAPELAAFRKARTAAESELRLIEDGTRSMLVTERMEKPRVMRILPRGNWLDESGEVVQPMIPRFLPQSAFGDLEERRATRLDLAKWLVSDENPLTARTFVNRIWSLFFGRGLSANLDDLGGQGQPPTHPELLDWLAVEFRESGWDVKHLVRLIVTSAAYRQSSRVTAELRESDPANDWYARQGRWRLDAEFVRDSVLSVSGLLDVSQIGGRSVKPYQPSGYWRHLNFPMRKWKADSGSLLYRRSLYTYWCRTFLHPAMLAFDAPSREECSAKRAKSNIPQQALVMLNEPGFLEASRVFAMNVLAQESDTNSRLKWAFQTALTREPLEDELRLLLDLLEQQTKRFAEKPAEAEAFLKIGAAAKPDKVDSAELAAWTQLTRAMFNMYEATSRF